MLNQYFIMKIVILKRFSLKKILTDLEESEGKMSQMYKSMEMKQAEVER